MQSGRDDTTDITAVVTQYNAAFLRFLSEKYGGDSTVNEIRVANCIVRAYFSGNDVGVSTIADELTIPKSTVSRAVSKLERQGWVSQECSTSDGRRRNLRLTKRSVGHIQDEKHFLFQYWRSYIAGLPRTDSAPSVKLPNWKNE